MYATASIATIGIIDWQLLFQSGFPVLWRCTNESPLYYMSATRQTKTVRGTL